MGRVSDSTRELMALTLIPGLGPVRIDRLMRHFGSAGAVLRATSSGLASVRGIGNQTARSVVEHRVGVEQRVEEEIRILRENGCSVVGIGDDRYPRLLRGLEGAPPILEYRGSIGVLGCDGESGRRGGINVAMVGSRGCTVYGIEQANRFAGSFGSAGCVVVSGGAKGIDSAAHRGAMDAGGVTAVVLGCGLGHVYPKENGGLFDRVVETGGVVVSELGFGVGPSAEQFPARNRIISGLSHGVLVIEAGRKSGALITARHAVEDHGREVFAVPGRVDSMASAGSLGLLKDGAHLVTEPGEVLEVIERGSGVLWDGVGSRNTDLSHEHDGGAHD